MELHFQDGVDRTGSEPSSMAGFDVKGVELSDSCTDVVICWLKLSIFDAKHNKLMGRMFLNCIT
jgi:hypothetical protein